RDPGVSGQAVDRPAEVLDRRGMPRSHRVHRRHGRRRGHCNGARRSPQAISSSRKEPCMKLGVHVGYWGLGMGPQDQLNVVQEAERLGYYSVWTAEAYGSDAATVLAWLAAGTSTIKLGSAI